MGWNIHSVVHQTVVGNCVVENPICLGSQIKVLPLNIGINNSLRADATHAKLKEWDREKGIISLNWVYHMTYLSHPHTQSNFFVCSAFPRKYFRLQQSRATFRQKKWKRIHIMSNNLNSLYFNSISIFTRFHHIIARTNPNSVWARDRERARMKSWRIRKKGRSPK